MIFIFLDKVKGEKGAKLGWEIRNQDSTNKTRNQPKEMKIYTNQKTQFENGETFRRLSRDSEVKFVRIFS